MREVIELLERVGWRQGIPRDSNDKRMCLGTALNVIVGHIEDICGFSDTYACIIWNDESGRTWEQVKARLVRHEK